MKKFISAVALLAYLWAGGAPAFAASIDSNHKLVVQANNTGTPGTFLDTASGAKTITTNGGATQLPYKLNNTAGFFNGSTDFVYVADHADWDVGTGDFTIETFAMFTSTASYQTIVGRNNFSEMRLIVGGGAISLDLMGSPGIISRSWTPTTYTWYHIAVSRSGTTLRLFIDGVQQGANVTDSTNITGTSPLIVGAATTTPDYSFPGWFKEFRFSNTARYTAGFTPTTTQFTSDSNTKLLLHFDNSSHSVLEPAIKFDGTGDALSAADHADWDFGSGSFTLEADVKFRSTQVGYVVSWNTENTYILYHSATGYIYFAIEGSTVVSAPFAPVTGRWYHIAAVRNGSACAVYVDGVEIATGTNSTSVANGQPLSIGSYEGSTSFIDAYMKNVRISNSARYTAAFAPSQSLFVSDSNTKLLLAASENNGVTTFVDTGNTGHTITTAGNTIIAYEENSKNTIFKDDGNTGHKPYGRAGGKQKIDFVVPFGAGGGQLDGSGDYLTLADSADWLLGGGTGKFTIGGWVNFRTIANNSLVGQRNDGSNGWTFQYSNSSAELQFKQYGASVISAVGSWTPIVNTWYYIEVVRGWGGNANDYGLTANGTLLGSATTDADSVTNFTGGLAVFGDGIDYPAGYPDGRFDNFTISDVARHSATFNPESSDFTSGRKRAALVI